MSRLGMNEEQVILHKIVAYGELIDDIIVENRNLESFISNVNIRDQKDLGLVMYILQNYYLEDPRTRKNALSGLESIRRHMASSFGKSTKRKS